MASRKTALANFADPDIGHRAIAQGRQRLLDGLARRVQDALFQCHMNL